MVGRVENFGHVIHGNRFLLSGPLGGKSICAVASLVEKRTRVCNKRKYANAEARIIKGMVKRRKGG